MPINYSQPPKLVIETKRSSVLNRFKSVFTVKIDVNPLE